MSDAAPGPRTGPVTWIVVVAVAAGIAVFSTMRPRGNGEAPAPAGTRGGEGGVADDEIAGVASPSSRTGILGRSPGAMIDVPAVERSGRELTTGSLRGRWNGSSFIFTSCGGTCPRLCAELAKLSAAMQGDDAFRILSFTVDPETDTPETLARYASSFGADAERWLFLRLSDGDVQKLARGLAVNNDPAKPVNHANSLTITDPDGRVVAKYEPLEDPEWIARLLRELPVLRARHAKGDAQ
jgi:protein SCO1/2